ncbi:hypothetical protein Q0Z83_046610 [Actinoplanes sichuanensis]|uniref:PEP-CTERM protein-sorting domain-containing protein n=1 Tax=Actinoplanes sichuanensis TaxID=512349 RepID=A0ABW4ABB4_9ACTN|nr:hypothetical protein [Actinoplanes sichuanensis]BEL06470.1 hypothetical protein Q0Z83_046610 [Actinoplanes sichuanensis]
MGDLVEFLMIHPSLVERPDLVFLVAGAFAAVGILALVSRRRHRPILSRSWPCFVVAALWVLYALWEAELTGKGYDMRVDLILIHPFITLVSVAALVSVLWRPRRSAVDDPNEAVA